MLNEKIIKLKIKKYLLLNWFKKYKHDSDLPINMINNIIDTTFDNFTNKKINKYLTKKVINEYIKDLQKLLQFNNKSLNEQIILFKKSLRWYVYFYDSKSKDNHRKRYRLHLGSSFWNTVLENRFWNDNKPVYLNNSVIICITEFIQYIIDVLHIIISI